MNRLVIAGIALFALGCKGETGDTDTDVPAYEIEFTGVSYDTHNGKTVHAVLEDEEGAVVGADSVTTISIGVFQFKWPDLEDGIDYKISWYVDVNADSACGAPPADQTWTHVVSVAGADEEYEHTYQTNFDPSACDAFAAE